MGRVAKTPAVGTEPQSLLGAALFMNETTEAQRDLVLSRMLHGKATERTQTCGLVFQFWPNNTAVEDLGLGVSASFLTLGKAFFFLPL